MNSDFLILLFFRHFWSQMTVYDGPWGDYKVIRVRGTMGDIISLLGTYCRPLEQIYTGDKSLTSSLLILLFYTHFWSKMKIYVGPWGDYLES